MSGLLTIDLPTWAKPLEDRSRCFAEDSDKMRFVIALSRLNVERDRNGPFGAAVFARGSGRLTAIGVNSVLRLKNSVLHAEMLAIMRAQHALGTYTLNKSDGEGYELFASCEPCAMCLGGTLWSGARRLVCAATAAEARAIGFDEGPVWPQSYRYLADAGIEVVRGLLADEAAAVIRDYRARGGVIYNG